MESKEEIEETQSSGLWGILPSWTTPKKVHSYLCVEYTKEKDKFVFWPRRRTKNASSMVLSTPKESRNKQKEPLNDIALSAEQIGGKEPIIKRFTPKKQPSLDEIMKTPRLSIGGMVTSKFSLQAEEITPPKTFEVEERSFFMEELLNETIEDLENVGLPFTEENDNSPEDSTHVSPVGTPSQRKTFLSKLQDISTTPDDSSAKSEGVTVAVEGLGSNENVLQSKLTLEFDPLIPKDWMMSFDSPNPVNKAKDITLSSNSTATEQKMSLLDSFEPMSSPNSAFRYNKHDLDRLEKELTFKFEKEFALAQEELNDMNRKNETLVEENSSMKATLLEWEKAVKSMIADKEKEQEVLNTQILQLHNEKAEFLKIIETQKKDLEEHQLKYKQLRLDFTDLRELSDNQKNTSEKMKEELAIANARFDKLRQHAESKLEEANVEIARRYFISNSIDWMNMSTLLKGKPIVSKILMNDSSLKSLVISSKLSTKPITLTPSFVKGTKVYNAVVESKVESERFLKIDVAVKTTCSEADAFAQVQKMNKDGLVQTIYGSNLIEIAVEAPDGSKSTYQINVYRPTESDVTLKELIIPEGLSLVPPFSNAETEYFVDVPTEMEIFDCKLVPINSQTVIEKIGNPEKLFLGETQIQFKVLAENKSNEATYTITLRKGNDFLTRKTYIQTRYLQDRFNVLCMCLPSVPTPEYLNEKEVQVKCTICGTVTKDDVLKSSNKEKEKEFLTIQFNCPLACKTTIDLQSMKAHLKLHCSQFPVNCSECGWLDRKTNLDGSKHSSTCHSTCSKCSKSIPNGALHLHNFNCNFTLTENIKLKDPNLIESTLVNKKKYSYNVEQSELLLSSLLQKYTHSLKETWSTNISNQGKKYTPPKISLLLEALEVLATMIAYEVEQFQLTSKAPSVKLLLSFEMILCELELVESMFPEHLEKVMVDNENVLAKESFIQDEVTGLLLQLGIPPSADNATKIKAMDAEYHRLKNDGKINEASEIQELITWKLKVDASNGTSSNEGKKANYSKYQELLYDACYYLSSYHKDSYEGCLAAATYFLKCENYSMAHQYASLGCSILPNCTKIAAVWAISYILSINQISQDDILKLDCAIDHLSKYSIILLHRSGEETPQNIGMLIHFCGFDNLFTDTFFALAKGYALKGEISDGVNTMLNLLYVLPPFLFNCSRNTQGFVSLCSTLCKALANTYELLYLTKNNESNPVKAQLESSLFSISSHLLKDSNPEILYQISQLYLLYKFESLTNLLNLANSQLQLYESTNDQQMLNFAQQTFQSVIGLENGLLPNDVQSQPWWLGLNNRISEYKKVNNIQKNPKLQHDSQQKSSGGSSGKKIPAVKVSSSSKVPVIAKSTTVEKGSLKLSAATKNSAKSSSKSGDKVGNSSKVISKNSSKDPPSKKAEVVEKIIEDTLLDNILEKKDVFENNSISSSKRALTRYGLAKVYTYLVTHHNPELLHTTELQQNYLEKAVAYYKEVIDIDSHFLDAYIELGNLLLKLKDEERALEVYISYPFQQTASQDELYLHSEINRLLIKHKKFKHPKLLDSLVMEGKASGIKSVSTYVDALDAAGEYKILMKLYASVSGKSETDSDM
ncbi:hypothetical protein HDV04_003499, partial [Boothiomyces sp. JEL0838]